MKRTSVKAFSLIRCLALFLCVLLVSSILIYAAPVKIVNAANSTPTYDGSMVISDGRTIKDLYVVCVYEDWTSSYSTGNRTITQYIFLCYPDNDGNSKILSWMECTYFSFQKGRTGIFSVSKNSIENNVTYDPYSCLMEGINMKNLLASNGVKVNIIEKNSQLPGVIASYIGGKYLNYSLTGMTKTSLSDLYHAADSDPLLKSYMQMLINRAGAYTEKTLSCNFSVLSDQNGTINKINDIYPAGTSLTINATPNIGYKFIGWFDNLHNLVSSNKDYTFNAPSGEYRLTAEFAPIDYKLSFNSNGGRICLDKTVTFNTALGTLPTPYKTGYTFSHWEDSSNNIINSSSLYNWTADTTLNAVYTTNNYSIEVLNTSTGATGATLMQPFGSVVNLYAGCKDGYFFTGWNDLYGNVVLENPSRASTNFTMPEENVKLQATWKKITDIDANLNNNFKNTYLDYFNGTAYDIDDQIIIVDKSMLNVRVNFDDGTFLVLSDDQYSLESNTIKKTGENLVKVKLNGSSFENYVRIIGYSLTFNKNLLTALPVGTYIDFTWLSTKSDCGYELELDGKIVKVGLNTSYRYTGLKPSTQHSYRLKTTDVSGTVQWSPIQTIFTTEGTLTKAPENISSNATNNKIIITWNPVDDAAEYDIQLIAPDGTSIDAINNGSNTTCELSGLDPATTYQFKIRAINDASDGPWSEAVQTTTKQLDTPQNIKVKSSDTSILFSWDKVEGATSYKFKINGIELTDPIYETSYLYTTTPNTEYRYSIMAIGSAGESSWREEKRISSLPAKPGIPKNVFATVSDSKITVNWTKLSDNDIKGYDIELDKIEENEILGDEIILENGTKTVYTHDELEPYCLYSYRVRARNELVEGDWSEIKYIRTLPAKPVTPKDITIRSTQTGATISWKPEAGATGYYLYVYKLDENDNEVKIEEITNIEECKYTHRKQTYGAEYRYRIRTRNVQGISDWSCDIINNAIKAECKKNNTIDLGLTATDVVDFSSYEMVVTYNPSVVEVKDLSTLTGKEELAIGKIEDTNITIKDFSNGRIVFAVDKAVNPGEAWTGVINGIKFKAKETGGTTITYTVFTKPQQ